MKKILNKLKCLLMIILVLLCAFFIEASTYYKATYPKQDFDLILFTIKAGVTGSSPDVVKNILFTCLGPFIVIAFFFYITLLKHTKHKLLINIRRNNSNSQFQLFPIKLTSNHRFIYMTIIVVVSMTLFMRSFGIDEYIKYQLQDSTIFEDYYINPSEVPLKFPDKKRNLIIIVGESFENTVFSKENGGVWDSSLMPELENLALNNINFSNSTKIGGAQQIYGTDYSAAGNVAITAGIPQKVGDFTQDANQYVNDYNGYDKFLSGVYSIGEVLQDNGYTNEIIMGSDGRFGNRKQYYECNGGYKVFDVYYAIDNGKMTNEDKVWWGFDDDHLYEWSKEELINLASHDEPFNFIMITADTHFYDGYLSPYADDIYPTQYENVHAYASKCANNFVNWVKQQDFYENTTIVIVGDHLGMNKEFYEQRIEGNYTRTIYNTFINSAIPAKNTTNRTFTSMDIYPTMLASIGVSIEGERLALGTNLFSGKPTLAEELGLEYLDEEVRKKSIYYNHNILGDEYYVLKKEYDDKERKEQEPKKSNT